MQLVVAAMLVVVGKSFGVEVSTGGSSSIGVPADGLRRVMATVGCMEWTSVTEARSPERLLEPESLWSLLPSELSKGVSITCSRWSIEVPVMRGTPLDSIAASFSLCKALYCYKRQRENIQHLAFGNFFTLHTYTNYGK